MKNIRNCREMNDIKVGGPQGSYLRINIQRAAKITT
jgi:hypothetical protein